MQQKDLPTALVEGALPATRKVVTRSPGHTVRSINLSHLQPTAIEADSSLERDFVYVALGFPQLKEITHQPFKLKLAAGFYTPDFLVRFKDESRAVVEVKPKSMVADFAEKLTQAEIMLASVGVKLIVAHDALIRRSGIELRAKQIRRYAKGHYSAEEQALVFDALRQAPDGLSIKNLISLGVQKVTILHMISHQRLQASSNLDIDVKSVVQIPVTLTEEGCHAIRFASWLNA